MNTPLANSQVERKRKNAIVLCKAIAKYLSEHVSDEIDTHLDEALDRLAEVQIKMHDAHLRALEERERYEKEQQRIEQALEHGRRHAKRIKLEKREPEPKNVMRGLLAKMSKEEKEALAMKLMKDWA